MTRCEIAIAQAADSLHPVSAPSSTTSPLLFTFLVDLEVPVQSLHQAATPASPIESWRRFGLRAGKVRQHVECVPRVQFDSRPVAIDRRNHSHLCLWMLPKPLGQRM